MRRMIHICSFQAIPDVTRKTRYEDFKAAALEAGRFSAFEASANRYAASMFTRLCHDPDVETETLGYPWTAVRKLQQETHSTIPSHIGIENRRKEEP